MIKNPSAIAHIFSVQHRCKTFSIRHLIFVVGFTDNKSFHLFSLPRKEFQRVFPQNDIHAPRPPHRTRFTGNERSNPARTNQGSPRGAPRPPFKSNHQLRGAFIAKL
jgi:hypothetical protein